MGIKDGAHTPACIDWARNRCAAVEGPVRDSQTVSRAAILGSTSPDNH